jgi:hypothetical protein
LPVWPGTTSSITMAPWALAVRLMAAYSAAVPSPGSMSSADAVEVAVDRRREGAPGDRPPACFIGPVWMAWMPISAKACQSAGSPSVCSTDAPGG